MAETFFAILWTDFLALGVVDPDVEPEVVLCESRQRPLFSPQKPIRIAPVIDDLLSADLIRKNSDGTRNTPP